MEQIKLEFHQQIIMFRPKNGSELNIFTSNIYENYYNIIQFEKKFLFKNKILKLLI